MMERVFQKFHPSSSSILKLRLRVGVKQLNRMLLVVFVAAMLIAPSAQLVSASSELTVEIGQHWYNAGDTVTITGVAPAGTIISITVKHANELIYTGDVVADITSEYEAQYILPLTSLNGFYTATATGASITSKAVFVVTIDSIAMMVRQQIETAEQSKIMSDKILHELTSLGNTVPTEATLNMAKGSEALQESIALHTEGKYAASAEAAKLAMNQFARAITLTIRNAKNEYEYKPNQSEVLANKIEQLVDQVEKLSTVIANLEKGEDITEIEGLIGSAKTSLELAATKIDEEKFIEATTAIAAAQKDLQDVKQLLQPQLMECRHGLMEQYKNRLKERVTVSTVDLEQLGDQIQASNMNAAMQRFGEVNGLILRAETRLKERFDEDALTDLEDASNRFRQSFSELGDNELSQGLMRLDMIRCQIQVQQGIAERLRKQGMNSSTVDSQIQELQNLVDEGMRRMMHGDASGANGLFQDAEQSGHYYGSGGSGSSGGHSGKN